MKIKRSVFGSRSEARGFRSIESSWGEDYALYPQFPFSALFEAERRIPGGLTNLFYTTSIDYVLCSREGEPLLAIDFDGLGEGFSKLGEYVKGEETDDKRRKSKFDFKLRSARESGFPYYVVASQEFKYLDNENTLTVVDGIIGCTLSSRDFASQVRGKDFASLDEVENLEIDIDLKYDKFWQKTRDIMIALSRTPYPVYYRHSERFVTQRPNFKDLESLDLLEDPEEIGYVYTMFDTPVGEVTETAWMRRIDYCESILPKMSEFLAWNKLERRMQRRTQAF